MSTIKSTLLSAAIAVGALVTGNAVAANHFEVWNGSAWVQTGTTHLVGPTNAGYLGNFVPCNADFTLQVASGVATVTAASFTGSSACTNIITRGLPWTVAIVSGSGSSWSLKIGDTQAGATLGGVNVRIPFPGMAVDCPNATGRAPVNGTFTNGTSTTEAVFQFPSQALGPCTVLSRATPAPGHLRTTDFAPNPDVVYASARIMP